jgi:hypothetical protein
MRHRFLRKRHLGGVFLTSERGRNAEIVPKRDIHEVVNTGCPKRHVGQARRLSRNSLHAVADSLQQRPKTIEVFALDFNIIAREGAACAAGVFQSREEARQIVVDRG